jgi:hypothetical protein
MFQHPHGCFNARYVPTTHSAPSFLASGRYCPLRHSAHSVPSFLELTLKARAPGDLVETPRAD